MRDIVRDQRATNAIMDVPNYDAMAKMLDHILVNQTVMRSIRIATPPSRSRAMARTTIVVPGLRGAEEK